MTEQNKKTLLLRTTIKQLLLTDAHLGNPKNKRHSLNAANVLTSINGLDIINLQKTLQNIEPALQIIIESVSNFEKLLIIAQHPQASKYQNHLLPMHTDKWVHGALSNFKNIKITKKKPIFTNLNRIPNGIIILQSTNDSIILNETKYLEIPTIAFKNTADDPLKAQYPIIANTTSNSSINHYLNLFSKAALYGYAKNILKFKKKSTKTISD